MMMGMTLKEDIMPGKQTNILFLGMHAPRIFQNSSKSSRVLLHNYLMRRQEPIMWMYVSGDQLIAFLNQ